MASSKDQPFDVGTKMRSSFTFIRVRGIPIGAHWSWLFVFALIVWSLSTSLFPASYPGLGSSTYLVMGVVAALLLFASVLLHELAHSFVALREGMEIDGITLWLFGGVARFRGMFPSPGAEFRIAVAGPLLSLALAATFGAATFAGAAGSLAPAVQGILDYVWTINAIVAAFNLVPALPLDGGRILRAWLWHRYGNFPAATRSASRLGKGFGGALIGIGLLNSIAGQGESGGLWLVFLGWFLIQAAQSEAAIAFVQQAFQGRRVGEFMTRDPAVLGPDVTVADFLDHVVEERGHSTYPVVGPTGLLGLVSIKAAGAVPREERHFRRVSDAMVPATELRVLGSDTDMVDALEALSDGIRRAPVVDGGRVVGIISAADVTRALDVERARGVESETKTGRAGLVAWLVVACSMVVAGGYLYHPPYVVLEPGLTLDVTEDIEIDGITTDEVNGSYLLTSVRLEQPSALGLAFSWAASDRQILALSQVIPEGANDEDYFRRQRQVFRQSRTVAAAAAAQQAGLQVSIEGDGAVVQSVVPGSPAGRHLRRGDVIVAVDDRTIETAVELQESISSRPVGATLELTIVRDGTSERLTLQTTRLAGTADSIVGIGVVITTRNFGVDLPFDIRFEDRNIGGPSAGLAYTLAIYDLLESKDIAAGRTIGATGTMDIEGQVGPVGGVDAKAEALIRADADFFLVPAQEVDQVDASELAVRGVSDLSEAVSLLEAATT